MSHFKTVPIHASPKGGDVIVKEIARFMSISIHASPKGGDAPGWRTASRVLDFNPRLPEGRRQSGAYEMSQAAQFQSTPPRREATVHVMLLTDFERISIHASPKGGDLVKTTINHHTNYFNPRLPEGRRHRSVCETFRSTQFQSTPPRREATDLVAWPAVRRGISIHASPKGGDSAIISTMRQSSFQSTPPRREATSNA